MLTIDSLFILLMLVLLLAALGFFALLIVGIMLLFEGGYLAHLHLFNNPVTPMSKTTFYCVIIILVLIDIVQGRYQKKLLATKNQEN